MRFGKRSGTFPPLQSSLEGERGGEEEDGEVLPPFEEEEGEPLSRFQYVVEEEEAPAAAKRARNFIRFGRAHLPFDGRADEQQIKVGVFFREICFPTKILRLCERGGSEVHVEECQIFSGEFKHILDQVDCYNENIKLKWWNNSNNPHF